MTSSGFSYPIFHPIRLVLPLLLMTPVDLFSLETQPVIPLWPDSIHFPTPWHLGHFFLEEGAIWGHFEERHISIWSQQIYTFRGFFLNEFFLNIGQKVSLNRRTAVQATTACGRPLEHENQPCIYGERNSQNYLSNFNGCLITWGPSYCLLHCSCRCQYHCHCRCHNI